MKLGFIRYTASAIVVMLATASQAQNSGDALRKEMDRMDKAGAQLFDLHYLIRERAVLDICGTQFVAVNPSQHKQKWAKVRNKPKPMDDGETTMQSYKRHATNLGKPGACMSAADEFRTNEARRNQLKGIRLK